MHVVVVGAGFAGLEAARGLAHTPVSVTVIDRRNHHTFQPLLYQVATGGLAGPDIAAPIRQILQDQPETTVLLDEVLDVHLDRRQVVLSSITLDYDYLVIAAGAETHYFGHEDWSGLAPGLKSLDDALEIRRRIYLAYEAAEREPDPALRRRLMTFVIVGGGPTGVELAGAIAEIARHTLTKDFRNIDPARTRVVLLESVRLLPGMDPDLVEKARLQLERRGVEVRLGATVTALDETGVFIGSERIDAGTVLWAAGVRPSPLAARIGAALERGKVLVQGDLSLAGHPEVFVVGDMMALRQGGRLLPGVAQVAIQTGRHAAANIRRLVEGERTLPFLYRDKGMLATIGRSAAIAEIDGLKLSGFLAWLLWWAVHIFSLIGFRNRVAVMLEWMWAYLTWQRSARIILPERGPPAPAKRPASVRRARATMAV